MKKVILTIVLSFIGAVTFAQEFKNVTSKPIKPVVLRITDSMSTDDISLELINNFYKIELSDVATNKKNYTPKNKKYNEVNLSTKKDTDDSNYQIILDLAVRTTDEMRGSLHSLEETVA